MSSSSTSGHVSPKVSVIVTTYNSAATVIRTLESIRTQTMSDFELIVVDDASRDHSVALVEEFGDPRLRLIRNPRNRGIGGAKNLGIEAARGDYIAFLDSDDTWEPNKLEVQLAALTSAQSRTPLSFTAFWLHRAGDEKTVLRQPRKHGTWLRSILLGETFGLGSTLLATKGCFEAIGLFDERIRRMEDRDWTMRYLREWEEFMYLPTPLAHVYNSGWPRAETVKGGVDDLIDIHDGWLRARDRSLANLLRAGLNFELATAEYRTGYGGMAMWRLAHTILLNPSFARFLAYRFGRKLLQRDMT